ncbi:MAG TPA: acireductone synthase [Terracidiphilus sp.]|nr:acireductone synthase [Terracidiphilus sp.]
MTASPPSLYLLDIEGTVAPLTLTADLLFPFARAHFPQFLHANAAEPLVRADLALLAEENRAEKDPDSPAFSHPEDLRQALDYLSWLMDRDRKSTALKSLQGKIWKQGFESGDLQGIFFPDVPPALKRWSAAAKVAIYSSGSVEAQQLLFRHSNFGDLTPHLSGYFDTRTGPKAEPASYQTIANDMHVEPSQLQFFSDAMRELDAARSAGCATRLVVRPGNPAVENPNGHPAVESFE